MSQIMIQDLGFTYEGDYTPVFEGLDLQLDTNWRLGLVAVSYTHLDVYKRQMLQYHLIAAILPSFSFPPKELPDLRPEKNCGIIVALSDSGGDTNEAYPDPQRGHFEGQCRQGRLRRVPDFLPVCLQDFLHCCQSEVRE